MNLLCILSLTKQVTECQVAYKLSHTLPLTAPSCAPPREGNSLEFQYIIASATRTENRAPVQPVSTKWSLFPFTPEQEHLYTLEWSTIPSTLISHKVLELQPNLSGEYSYDNQSLRQKTRLSQCTCQRNLFKSQDFPIWKKEKRRQNDQVPLKP